MNQHADASDRLAVYRRLLLRNRLVGILRIGVPALGALTLVLLLVQIYLSSLGDRFGVGQIAVSRDSVSVEAPEYAGVLEDGSLYRVSAAEARAALETSDLIELSTAALSITRSSGVVITAAAPLARLDTTNQSVIIDGVARIADSTGIDSVLYRSVFDWAAQLLVSEGPVSVRYPDGTELEAGGLTYDAGGVVWTFSDVTVTLPSTPGADTP